MNNKDFWASIDKIISEGFTPEGLSLLDKYGEQFISGKLVYKRFSPSEQHGCSAGGSTHFIASLLAAAEVGSDSLTEPVGSFKREQQLHHVDWQANQHFILSEIQSSIFFALMIL